MAAEEELEELENYLNEKSATFDELCNERHDNTDVSFLATDVVSDILNSLADTVNYCRMQAIKLIALQETLEQELSFDGIGNFRDKEGEDLQIGFDSFKGMGDKK